ncbi:MAG TPA: chromate efflux transporter [Tepidisphaeraceae bacterium]|jgi:chromate transporter|nr:chromate efflux transporter [Tepidisphaeraceae bacterium]
MGHLGEVARLFLRLGFTAFGGPAAHIALMEDEVVNRRKWIDRQQFLDLVAAVNFIPGPNSTELAIHLGALRAGWKGLIVAGVCFIVPAMLIILPIGWLYVHYSSLPNVAGPLMGIRACMIAIIAAAMWRFARSSIRDWFTGIIAVTAAVAGFIMMQPRFRVPQAELIILAAAAVAGTMRDRGTNAIPLVAIPTTMAATTAVVSASAKFLQLALFFLKVGATLFGSGYVLVSYLRGGLVDEKQWLSSQQLTDAVAVGQFTPGPLLTTATFIGYILGQQWSGPKGAIGGAVLATAAIFFPSFCFVAALGPIWNRIRSSPRFRGALDGMNAAVVALILVVSITLGKESIQGIGTLAIAAISLFLLLKWNLNSTWLIIGSALVGWALQRFSFA